MSKRLIIVDDHPIVRDRLAELINREQDLEVCGEAEDRLEALDLISQRNPDMAIVDLTLKSSLGLELIKDIRIQHPSVLVLVVSMQDELVYAERCIRAGAQGYITKQQASRHIMQAIRKVLAGDLYLSEAASAQLLSRSLRIRKSDSTSHSLSILTDRELQVFELIGRGHSTRQIAEFLSIDVKTIETYRARLKDKLGLKDSAALLQRAIVWVHQGAG